MINNIKLILKYTIFYELLRQIILLLRVIELTLSSMEDINLDLDF